MDFTHAHLFTNHLPIIGSIINFIFFAYALSKKRVDLIRLALWFFVVIAVLIIPVYLTGSPAEESIINLPGMSEDLIEPHESAGLVTFIIMEVIGVVSLITVLIYKKDTKIPSWIGYSIAVAALAFIISAGITANSGGQIRHPEIRPEEIKTE